MYLLYILFFVHRFFWERDSHCSVKIIWIKQFYEKIMAYFIFYFLTCNAITESYCNQMLNLNSIISNIFRFVSSNTSYSFKFCYCWFYTDWVGFYNMGCNLCMARFKRLTQYFLVIKLLLQEFFEKKHFGYYLMWSYYFVSHLMVPSIQILRSSMICFIHL